MGEEVSPGGGDIVRHEAREREPEPTEGDVVLIDAIDEHLTRTFGEHDGMVIHEEVSDLVHVDVHWVPPDDERPWTTLVTSGMAERPMTVPDGLEDYRWAELILALPPDWPLDQDAWEDERLYWPIRLLKELARFPHEHETFLYYGHTVEDEGPPQSYAEGTGLCSALIGRPELIPEELETVEIPDGRVVNLYGVFPLHHNELEFKLQKGADALWDRLYEAGVTELLDPERESVIGRRRRLLGRS